MLCTATQQKNGPGSEEEADQNAAEKVPLEEKSQLETRLKDMTVSFERKGVVTQLRMERSLHLLMFWVTIFISEVQR